MRRLTEFAIAALVTVAVMAPLVALQPIDQPNGVRRAASLLEKKHFTGGMPRAFGAAGYGARLHQITNPIAGGATQTNANIV